MDNLTTANKAAQRKRLCLAAAAQVAAYPQYDGYFRGHRLARVTRTVVTKMGQAFAAGEIVLALTPPPTFTLATFRYVSAWSMANACDTSVPAGALEWL